MSEHAISRTRWRNVALKGILFALGLCAVSAATEYVLERLDAVRFTAGDTFYATHGRRIRYRLTGQHNPGPTLVLLDGLTASLEQWDGVQTALSTKSPVLSYDRGGTGFSDPAVAHDAYADADELDQLLHSPQVASPFVLVSYSNSMMLATVYAARHPDSVKGVIFIDPVIRSQLPGSKTFRRIFWRFNLITLEAYTGYTRLRLAMSGGDALPSAQASEKYNAVMKSAHHWLASTHDAMSLDKASDEADAALATHPFAHIPVGMLSTLDRPPDWVANDIYMGPIFREVVGRQKKLAMDSDKGVVREFHGPHTQLLNDPSATRHVVDLVRTIVDEARAKAATGTPIGTPRGSVVRASSLTR